MLERNKEDAEAIGAPGTPQAGGDPQPRGEPQPRARRRRRRRRARTVDEREHSAALDANIRAIRRWEEDALHRRSRAELMSEWITCAAARAPVLFAHAVWFALWIAINTGWVPGIQPFDPFPFQLLTMIVSLEAIFLALFVLGSQNRMTQQADKRAHLDLQIDLLAEREMTAVLQLLTDIARHLDAKVSVSPDQIRDLGKETDLHELTTTLDGQLPSNGETPPVRPVRDQVGATARGVPQE